MYALRGQLGEFKNWFTFDIYIKVKLGLSLLPAIAFTTLRPYSDFLSHNFGLVSVHVPADFSCLWFYMLFLSLSNCCYYSEFFFLPLLILLFSIFPDYWPSMCLSLNAACNFLQLLHRRLNSLFFINHFNSHWNVTRTTFKNSIWGLIDRKYATYDTFNILRACSEVINPWIDKLLIK